MTAFASQGRGGPARLGPYALLRPLGEGSFGRVYLAQRPGDPGPVALKVVSAQELEREDLARFHMEAEIAGRLWHPGIVRVLDVGRDGDQLYFAMEPVSGPTLAERLKQGPLEVPEATRIVAELADAVAAAHAAGVLHRDLKPANVIFEGDRPRILDFGLARDRSLLRSLTQTGEVLGTPLAMSPEQIQGARDLDERSDVYSLGVILYQCLTGALPHQETSFLALARAVVQDPPRSPRALRAGIPTRLELVCLRALAKDRAARWPTAAAFADALRGAERYGAAPPAARSPLAYAAFGGLLAILALGAGGLAGYLSRRGRPEPPADLVAGPSPAGSSRASSGPASSGPASSGPASPRASSSPASPSPGPSTPASPAPATPAPAGFASPRSLDEALAEALAAARGGEAARAVERRYDEAERLARGDDARARVDLARAWLRYRRGDHPGALELVRALGRTADPTVRAEASMIAAEVRLEARDLAGAERLLQAIGPEAAPGVALLARAWREVSETLRARPAPQVVRARLAEAKALARKATQAGAPPVARQLEPWLDLMLGAALGERDPEGTLARIRAAIAASPDDVQAHFLLALAGFAYQQDALTPEERRRFLEASLEGTTRVLALNAREDVQRVLQHAHVLFLLGRPREAREGFARALALDPGSVECQVWQAACDAKLGREDAAHTALRALARERGPELERLLRAGGQRIQLGEVAEWARRLASTPAGG